MGSDASLLVLLAVAFIAAVFLAAAETALLRIRPVRAHTLAAESVRGRRVHHLVTHITRVLNTILLTALLAQIGAATLVGILTERWFGGLGVTVGSVVLTIVLFIYAEAIPKTYAVRHPDRVALALAIPIAALDWLLRPLVWVLIRIADAQAPGRGITTSPTVTEGEIRMLAGTAAAEGEIETFDVEFIERAFRFGDRRADDIMVPRPDIVGVAQDATVEEAIRVAVDSGHRRLIVFGETVDEITGVVRLRDLVAVPPDRGDVPVASLATEPLVVPETKRVVGLLREMQESGTHLAIVVDEYGGTAGLVTVEDVAEELLGSISQGSGEAEIVQIDEHAWSVDGLVPIEDLEVTTGVVFDSGEGNTVAGLVLEHLGRLPVLGDEVEVSGVTLRVTAVRRRRVLRVEARAPRITD